MIAPVTLRFEDPVTALDGVGPAMAKRMAEGLGISTIRDLVEHWPRRYQDAGEVLDLSEVVEGQPATLLGEVVRVEPKMLPPRQGRRRLTIIEIQVRQAGGETFLVTFFNQRWRANQLSTGTVAAFSGTVKRFRSHLQLQAPDVQVLGRVAAQASLDHAAERLQHQRLLAVYPSVEGLPTFKIAEFVGKALDALETCDDWLPAAIRSDQGLISFDQAVRDIHRPADWPSQKAARKRLVFDELFTLQLGLQWRRTRLEADAVGLDNSPRTGGRADHFLLAMPFSPTAAQNRAFAEIGDDLSRQRPMHRLLQGDVGSGKTVVALWTMLNAVDQGRQAALMVPTEVLADQHLRTVLHLLAPLGVNVLDGIRIDALTASSTKQHRRRVLGELLSGDIDIVLGTHALLEEGVRFADLGVVVVDEQHRFGVAQRVKLKDKADGQVVPDVLVMTATPIPRSLAMTIYGDLDVTVLDELPPGRQPVATRMIPPSATQRRQAVYDFIRQEAAEGRRAYIVCPFVEPSEAAAGTSAVAEHERLATEVFSDLTVELVHGRMRSEDKDAAMARFRSGEAQVLVATTVVEVGVDVPEATVMVIEDAERFGISQLHQLRGRVGRGDHRSYCVLFAGWNAELGDDTVTRLEAVCATTDGFELAETDLELRGAGQLFGRRQSGLPDLKLARLGRDTRLLATTRQLASDVVKADPDLQQGEHAALRLEIDRRFQGGIAAFEALETG
ncbi:MAG: ATP-dependent DNA helicase RecG [Nitriliruptoraceae bacterium]